MKPTILIAVIVAAIRLAMLFVDFNEHLVNGYKDFAHLFVGGLIGVWLTQDGKILWLIPILLQGFADRQASWQIRTASALSIIEIVCATITAIRGQRAFAPPSASEYSGVMSYNSSFACIGALLALIGILVIALYVILRFPNDRQYCGLRPESGGGRVADLLQSLVIVAALRDLVIWIPVLVIIAVLRWCGIGFNPYHKGPDKFDD